MRYRRSDLHDDVAAGMFGAGWLSTLAAPPLALLGLYNLVQQVRGHQEFPWLVYVLFLVLVALAYLLAGISIGLMFFLLRPFRRFWIGWVLTGSASGICLYGSVFVAAFLLWNPAGQWFMNHDRTGHVIDRWDLARMIPYVVAIFGTIGAVVGLYLYFTDEASPRRDAA
jgi:hypothetical protein